MFKKRHFCAFPPCLMHHAPFVDLTSVFLEKAEKEKMQENRVKKIAEIAEIVWKIMEIWESPAGCFGLNGRHQIFHGVMKTFEELWRKGGHRFSYTWTTLCW